MTDPATVRLDVSRSGRKLTIGGPVEVELAFSTLFGTFGEPFFRRYGELRPLRPGFFEARRDLYNLYPLLVHTALFGGHYARSVAQIADRFA